MPAFSSSGTRVDNPQVLLNDFIGRLQAAEPINTLENSPIQGADQRNVAEMTDILKRLKQTSEDEGARYVLTTKPLREELDLLFRNRQDYLQSLDPSELQYFGNRLQDWTRESGLTIEDLNNRDFGGIQHETVSHYLPWQKGYSLDIEPKSVAGYRLAANPASPLNELLATEIDRALLSGKPIDLRKAVFSRSGEQRLTNFYNSLGQYAAAMSEQGTPAFSSKELEGPRGAELLDKLKYFQGEAQASNPFAVRSEPGGPLKAAYELPPNLAGVGLQMDEASKLLNWKFVEPLRQRFENLGKAQAPFELSRDFVPSWTTRHESLLPGLGGRKFREIRALPTEETNYNRMLNLGQTLSHYLHDISGRTSTYGGASNMLFSVDPAVAAAKGGGEFVRALRNTPSALLPGVADLIPSPEAIQTGYAQGPVAMGQQMGREFIQSLPQALAYSSALAAAPVLAPGVGAGMVGTAGARALNEVVRQETGEGIVPKLRQAIGTAPRTGVASPQRTTPAPLTQQIRPLTQAQRAEMTRQANRNELQRRMDLMRERFNPRRGEFGLSELLFGR